MTLPTAGPWTLPIAGFEVLQVTFAHPIDLVAYGDEGATAFVRFESEFAFAEPGGEVHELSASRDSWESLAVVLSLRHDRITSAQVSESADLDVEFESGRRLQAGPDPSYESWEVSGPGVHLVAMPGRPGTVAAFDGTSATVRARPQ